MILDLNRRKQNAPNGNAWSSNWTRLQQEGLDALYLLLVCFDSGSVDFGFGYHRDLDLLDHRGYLFHVLGLLL